MSFVAQKLDLTGLNAIDQGADWLRELFLYAVPPSDPSDPFSGTFYDATGCTFKAQIRERYDSPTAVDIVIAVMSANPCQLQLRLPKSATAPVTRFAQKWDLFITYPSGLSDKVFYGDAAFIPSQTRLI